MTQRQCVVFNSSHEPLAVVPAERGLILVLEEKAYILEEVPNQRFRSPNKDFPIPTSIIMKEYRNTGARYYGNAVKNQRNMFVRDNYTCQYCLRPYTHLKRNEYLTRDHMIPLSQGGKDEWTNIITACSTCNHMKDDRDLNEFQEYLNKQLDEFQSRPSSPKKRSKEQERVAQMLVAVDSINNLKRTPPKAPTVFEIMMKRSKKLKKAAA